MFTGIVTHRGLVEEALDLEGGSRRLLLRSEPALEDVALGQSIAVDGVCLTVADLPSAGVLAFDVVPETLRKTTLGVRVSGDRVNLERSLHLGDEMGGHVVQGHVEGKGEVVGVEAQGEDVRLTVRVGPELFSGMIPKGSVTLDGVSLTLGEVWREDADPQGAGRISVYLVPHTLAVTGFASSQVGDPMNVEPDVLGRWVQHHVEQILGRSS